MNRTFLSMLLPINRSFIISVSSSFASITSIYGSIFNRSDEELDSFADSFTIPDKSKRIIKIIPIPSMQLMRANR
jgi:hypothetical protein